MQRAEVPAAPERVVVAPVAAEWSELVAASVEPGARRPVREGEEERRIESSLTEREIEALIAAARTLPVSDRIDRVEPVEGAGLTLGTSFDSIDVLECCGSGTLNPPDPELAAGPNHLIAAVNKLFRDLRHGRGLAFRGGELRRLLRARGHRLRHLPVRSERALRRGRRSLPRRRRRQRHALLRRRQPDARPDGGVVLLRLPDQRRRGVLRLPARRDRPATRSTWGGNMFGGGTGRIWAFDKVAMYAGDSATAVTHDLGSNTTPQPANLHGAAQGTWPTAGPHYILTGRNGFGDPDTFGLFSWDDPFGANTLSDLGSLQTNTVHGVTVGFPVGSQQMGGGTITGNDPRPLDFEYRNGFGWMTNLVSCNPGGGTVNCIQWVQVDLDGATIADAGVFASDGVYRFFPDIAANHCDDAVVGYSKSSSSTFPGIAAAGREGGDPAGTMGGEVDVKAGEVTFGEPGRWGDYTGMTIGPDGSTFWYLGEYSKNIASDRNWGTWIGALSFAGCAGIFSDGFESGDTSAWDQDAE